MSYYCTKNEWAIKQGYTQYASNGSTGYLDDQDEPIDADLEDILEEMTDIMNSEDYLNSSSVITDVNPKRMRLICYNGTLYMLDERYPRAERRIERIGYIPKDYMRPTDRRWLSLVGVKKGTKYVGKTG